MSSAAVSRRAALALLLTLAAGRASAGTTARVVALDWGLAASLLALGHAPVGIAEIPSYRDWVIEPAIPADVRDVGLRTAPNPEMIAALRPDLIVIGPMSEDMRSRLELVAPVLSLPLFSNERRPLMLAREALLQLAARVGREGEASRLLADAEATFARCAARIRPRDRALLPVSFLDARHLRIYGAGSLFVDVMERLAVAAAWQGPTNPWGFAVMPMEVLADHGGADLLLVEPVPLAAEAGLARDGLWRSLPAVRAGRVLRLPPVWAFGELTAAVRFAGRLTDRLDAAGTGHAG